MNPDSRQIIHMGINFVVSPIPAIDAKNNLGFQQALIDAGIDFSKVELKEQEIVVTRESPTPLNVKVAQLRSSGVGQFLILAPHPKRPLSLFSQEAKAAVQAFNATWPEKKQVVSSDVTLRDLYKATGQHAFQELWEMRLGQSSDELAILERPVLGGGIRLIMPAQSNDPQPVQIEVKIESYLRDVRKIFVETQFKWPQSTSSDKPMDPPSQLRQVDDYVKEKVIPFIMGKSPV